MNNEEELAIPREFCEFAGEFDVGFISFAQHNQPIIKIVDFKVTPSKILVFSTTRLPLATVAFCLSNDKYLHESKTALVIGKISRVRKSDVFFLHEVLPKRIAWTDSFPLDRPPEHIINRVTFRHQIARATKPPNSIISSKSQDKPCNKPNIIPRELFLMFEKIRSPAILATARNENHPHLAPLLWWYMDPCLCITSTGGSVKSRNIMANKLVSLAAIDRMRKNSEGFVVQGTVVSLEYGILGFVKNLRNINHAMTTKAKSSFLSKDLIKHHLVYSSHPDVNYSMGLTKRVFAKIKPKKIKYWKEDQDAVELEL